MEIEKKKQDMKKYQVDEKTFAAMCRNVKKMGGDEVTQFLGHNPDLLNCLDGEPIRQSALGRNIPVIEVLMRNQDLEINLRDKNERTALHFGTSTDVAQIVRMLLKHRDIEVNPISKMGRTPVMEATRNGKIETLQVLLEDERIELEVDDADGQTLENMLPVTLAPHKIARANKLFQEARTFQGIKNGTIIRKKSAILVINTDYKKSEKKYASLEGPLHDLEIAKKVFEAKEFDVFVIRNSGNILEEVCGLIQEKQINDSDVVQFFFSGHGIHKATAEKGLFATGNEKETEFDQEGELGDCLVGTDGTLCEELLLSWQISECLKEDASMCFFYDMCRNEGKEAAQTLMTEFVKTNTLEYKRGVQKNGADRRMVRIFSAQLGQTSEGLNSFFQRICQEIEASSPRGMKLVDIMNFERSNQKCQIECVPGWDDKWWPLE